MKKATLSLASLVLTIFTLSLQLRADSILTTIDVGSSSAGVAANPATNKIYVGTNGQIVVIDGKTQQVIKKITGPPFANFLAANPLTNRIYASGCSFSTASCDIAVIDGKKDAVIANIAVNSGSFIGIQGLTVDPVTDRVYASDADNSQYIVIDGKTNSIITQVTVPIQPAGIAVNPKTNRIYIGDGGFSGSVLVYDGTTNTEMARIAVSSTVQGVATNFRLDRVYAAVGVSDTLAVLDGSTNSEITEAPVGDLPQGVDVNLINNKIYVANSRSSSVTIVDGNTNQVLQTVPLSSVFPAALAVNPATGLTYVTDDDGNQVVVLQPN